MQRQYDLSVIIPARNEIYLEKTIRNVLDNIRGNTEIIVILDGYLPEPQIITNDERVYFIHNKESRGQRQSINQAAKFSNSKYIMKLDAHCAVDEGFDVKLMADCKYDWTVIPRMYNLDVATFKPKLHKRTDYMYIGWNEKGELRSLYYSGKEWKKWHNRQEEIDDTMGCMGPCFFMHRQRFLDTGGCDENHGSWGSQGIEVACKAWLSGGAMKVNKKTWFAHWFRGGSGPGFPYKLHQSDVDKARKYAEDTWLNNKWEKQTRDFNWLLNKFKPPTWENYMAQDVSKTEKDLQSTFYKQVHLRRHDPIWHGIKMIKLPTDIVLYQMAIWEKKPDFIIDIGTAFCGSAIMFADFMEMNKHGHVISIDVKQRGPITTNPRVTYLRGDSKSDEIIKQIKEIVGNGSVMLSIDGDHSRRQVKWEMKKYANIVTSGQYMVAEDCYGRNCELMGPGEARDWFLSWNKDYKQTDFDKQFLVGFTKGGWLLKK